MDSVISLFASVLYFALLLYFFAMWARFVLDLVRVIRRDWRPRGVGLVAAETVYTVTDPPISFFRRLIKPVSVGPIALDFGWSLTMLCVIVGMYIATWLQRA